ncbi:exodeoxyribonuclease VII small subunit [Hyphomicrobiales bacterium]|jgi:exodeoxyribonuclease VII small subunit|nr:exodeoxyribonuclease VII small subunit [Hyphomicrobiales bacterium]MDA8892754.1 exodeoxyribonuclease VII small subunit [Hyphomicrobiales bacterium]MDA9034621.1 exodeoxyribonuclease VII small subunit [Hyphomicrobiales bacterium]MDA9904664.1 exodeoxyribonuclease VII small subunit [Hyphomicrobiales bacterium]MDB9926529.1 exodeoxyribonuclease VII small subunit [Hyphomicrobiales bacterium]|tara:strand:+ start:439 stop:693 length:255 start_codon:yes stop_codon:yes gene_type:complete
MNKKIEIKSDIKKLSFEEALTELEEIVGRLERGDIDLEDSISIYERGEALKSHCESKLEKAKMKVDKIITQPDGDFSSEPLDEI